jgi:hypothetical protein
LAASKTQVTVRFTAWIFSGEEGAVALKSIRPVLVKNFCAVARFVMQTLSKKMKSDFFIL